jgi:hypothetical protein
MDGRVEPGHDASHDSDFKQSESSLRAQRSNPSCRAKKEWLLRCARNDVAALVGQSSDFFSIAIVRMTTFGSLHAAKSRSHPSGGLPSRSIDENTA